MSTDLTKQEKSGPVSQIQRAGMIASACAVSYGFYDLTYRFLSLTPALSLKWGFLGGALSTAVIASGAYGLDTFIHTRPTSVFDQGRAIALASTELKTILGGQTLEANPLKAYRTNQGYFNLLTLRTPSTELAFKMRGTKGEAIIYVFTAHAWMFRKANMISCVADVRRLSGHRSRHLLAGKEDNDKVNSFLSQLFSQPK